jgi:hypothetical protein
MNMCVCVCVRQRETAKMIAFWDTELCSLVEVDRRFRGAYCLRQQSDEQAARGWSVPSRWRQYSPQPRR